MYFFPNECVHTPCRASIVGGIGFSAATKDRASVRFEGNFLLNLHTNEDNVDHEFLVLIWASLVRRDCVVASSSTASAEAEAILVRYFL